MKKSFIVLLSLLIVGCSTRMAYNNLDWISSWYVDDYITLTDAQEEMFESHVRDWLHWHRHHELPLYKSHLEGLKEEILNNEVAPSRVEKHILLASQHWESLRDEIAPELASLATQLSEEQVNELFAAIEESNQEHQEEIDAYSQLSQEEQREEQQQRIEDQVTRLAGSVTEIQQQIIARYVPQLVYTRQDWLDYRRKNQQAAREVFDSPERGDEFVATLTDVMTDSDRFRSEAYLQARAKNRQLYAQLTTELIENMTPGQRTALIDEIDDAIADMNALMADG